MDKDGWIDKAEHKLEKDTLRLTEEIDFIGGSGRGLLAQMNPTLEEIIKFIEEFLDSADFYPTAIEMDIRSDMDGVEVQNTLLDFVKRFRLLQRPAVPEDTFKEIKDEKIN